MHLNTRYQGDHRKYPVDFPCSLDLEVRVGLQSFGYWGPQDGRVLDVKARDASVENVIRIAGGILDPARQRGEFIRTECLERTIRFVRH